MRPIPPKLRKELEADPFYNVCARAGYHDHKCSGKITFEHVIVFAGSQINEKWCIIPLCEKAHSVNNYQDGGDLNKEINLWIALNRTSDIVLSIYSKAINYVGYKKRLNAKYGVYSEEKAIQSYKDNIGLKISTQMSTLPCGPRIHSGEKKFWYPVNKERQQKIQKVREYFGDTFEKFYSPFDLIDKSIDFLYDSVFKENKR